jgi:hypothetical protein
MLQTTHGGLLLLRWSIVKRLREDVIPKERQSFRMADPSTFGARTDTSALARAAAASSKDGAMVGTGRALSEPEADLAHLAGFVADAKASAVRDAAEQGLPLSGSPAYSCFRCQRGFACLRDMQGHFESEACLRTDYLFHTAPYVRGDGGVVLDWQEELGPKHPGSRLGVGSQGLRLLRKAMRDARRITSRLGGGTELAGELMPAEMQHRSESVQHDGTISLTTAHHILFLLDSARAMVAARATMPKPIVAVQLPPEHTWAMEFSASVTMEDEAEDAGDSESGASDAGHAAFVPVVAVEPEAYSQSATIAQAARRRLRASGRADAFLAGGSTSDRRLCQLDQHHGSQHGGSESQFGSSGSDSHTRTESEEDDTGDETDSAVAAEVVARTPFSAPATTVTGKRAAPKPPQRRKKRLQQRRGLTPLQRAEVEARGARALLWLAEDWEQTDDEDEDEGAMVVENGRVHALRG